MVQRSYSLPNEEPESKKFEIPSEMEHLFQVVEIYDQSNQPGKMNLDADTVCAKLEVVGGKEEGRTMLQRLSLDAQSKSFWATTLFLKAIGEPYKGDISINTDAWHGHLFYATVVHNKGFANIKEYNFAKKVDQPKAATGVVNPEDIVWDQ